MPKIPDIEPNENAPSGVSTREYTGQEFGAIKGEAFQQLGRTISEVSEKYDNIYQDSKANLAIAKAQRQLNDYSNELKYGPIDPNTGAPQLDGEGKPVAPIDPSLHNQKYQEKIDEIRNQVGDDLEGNGKALRKFSESFEPLANRHLMAVQSDAIGIMHHTAQANLERSLQSMSEQHVAAPDIAKARIQNDAFSAIQDAVDQRVITPREGFAYQQRFNHQAYWGGFRKIMNSGPEGPKAALQALAKGEFSEVPVDQQEKMFHMAIAARDSNDRHANAALDHKIKFAEFQAGIESGVAFNEAVALANHQVTDPNTGKSVPLTPGWVMQNQSRLRNHFPVAMKMAQGEDVPTNSITKIQMAMNRIQGLPADQQLKFMFDEVNAGRLSADNFVKNTEEMRRDTPDLGKMNALKAIEQDLHTRLEIGTPGAGNAGQKGSNAAVYSDAVQELLQYRTDNPNATDEDLWSREESILKRSGRTTLGNTRAIVLPESFAGTKSDLNDYEKGKKLADEATLRASEAYRSGQKSKGWYTQESKRLGIIYERLERFKPVPKTVK